MGAGKNRNRSKSSNSDNASASGNPAIKVRQPSGSSRQEERRGRGGFGSHASKVSAQSRDLDRSSSGHRGDRDRQWQPARGNGSKTYNRGFNRPQGSQQEEHRSPATRTKVPQPGANREEKLSRKDGQSSTEARQKHESSGARPKEYFASYDHRF